MKINSLMSDSRYLALSLKVGRIKTLQEGAYRVAVLRHCLGVVQESLVRYPESSCSPYVSGQCAVNQVDSHQDSTGALLGQEATADQPEPA
jgi:hypothetical protein